MFFRCGVAPPHPTAKPSWGWLWVGGSKPPLKIPELVTSRKKAIPGFMAYRRGCPKADTKKRDTRGKRENRRPFARSCLPTFFVGRCVPVRVEPYGLRTRAPRVRVRAPKRAALLAQEDASRSSTMAPRQQRRCSPLGHNTAWVLTARANRRHTTTAHRRESLGDAEGTPSTAEIRRAPWRASGCRASTWASR